MRRKTATEKAGAKKGAFSSRGRGPATSRGSAGSDLPQDAVRRAAPANKRSGRLNNPDRTCPDCGGATWAPWWNAQERRWQCDGCRSYALGTVFVVETTHGRGRDRYTVREEIPAPPLATFHEPPGD